MTKVARRVAEVAPVAESQENSQENSQATPKPEMQVLKPEPEEEQEPKPEKPNVYDVIRKIYDQYHRSEQHANYLQQLDKLQEFRSRINNNTNLMLSNGAGQPTFSSVDPAAVDMLIEICIKNVKGKIAEIENLLIAA